MPRFACAVVLACSALCPPAAADQLCTSVTFTGIPSQYVSPVVVCLPVSDDRLVCEPRFVESGPAGVVVVICHLVV